MGGWFWCTMVAMNRLLILLLIVGIYSYIALRPTTGIVVEGAEVVETYNPIEPTGLAIAPRFVLEAAERNRLIIMAGVPEGLASLVGLIGPHVVVGDVEAGRLLVLGYPVGLPNDIPPHLHFWVSQLPIVFK